MPPAKSLSRPPFAIPVVGARRHNHNRARRAARHLGRNATEQRGARPVRAHDQQTRLLIGCRGYEPIGRVTDLDQPTVVRAQPLELLSNGLGLRFGRARVDTRTNTSRRPSSAPRRRATSVAFSADAVPSTPQMIDPVNFCSSCSLSFRVAGPTLPRHPSWNPSPLKPRPHQLDNSFAAADADNPADGPDGLSRSRLWTPGPMAVPPDLTPT